MIVATRMLKLRRREGDAQVTINIYAPEKDPTLGWGCQFDIGWPDEPFSLIARGIDAVQALEISLRLIGMQLYASEYHEKGELEFDKPGSGYGFPVPTNLRDVLIGDDAKFF